MDGAERRFCCIIRTHSSIKASLEHERVTYYKKSKRGERVLRVPIVIQPYRKDIAMFLAVENFLRYRTFTVSVEVISQKLYIKKKVIDR